MKEELRYCVSCKKLKPLGKISGFGKTRFSLVPFVFVCSDCLADKEFWEKQKRIGQNLKIVNDTLKNVNLDITTKIRYINDSISKGISGINENFKIINDMLVEAAKKIKEEKENE